MRWQAPPGRIRHAASYALFVDPQSVFSAAYDHLNLIDGRDTVYEHHVKIDGSPSVGIGKELDGTPYVFYSKQSNKIKSQIGLNAVRNPVLKQALGAVLFSSAHKVIPENGTTLVGDLMYHNNSGLLDRIKPNALEYKVHPYDQRSLGIIFHSMHDRFGNLRPVPELPSADTQIHYGVTNLALAHSYNPNPELETNLVSAINEGKAAYDDLSDKTLSVAKQHEHEFATALHGGIDTVDDYERKRKVQINPADRDHLQAAIDAYNKIHTIADHTTNIINSLHMPSLNGFTPTELGHEGSVTHINNTTIKFVPRSISNILKNNPKYSE